MEKIAWKSVQDQSADRAGAIFVQMTALRGQLEQAAEQMMLRWQPRIERAEFVASVANMADWLALRQLDLTPLQAPLTSLGLSTLGRLEGHVRPSIDAVIAALAPISGAPRVDFPDPAVFAAGEALLAARRDALFGAETPGDPRTRVMVTLPTEAAEDDGALITRLVAAGADCFRVNCAHDGPEAWAAMINEVRRIEAVSGQPMPVSMDLGGPKFRVVAVSGKEKKLFGPGDRFALTRTLDDGPKGMICATLSHDALLAALLPGAQVSIDDGKLWARVVAVAPDHAVLEVTQAPAKGARIKPEKGVNLPGANLRVDALTADDLEALDFVAAHADIVSFSFVQTVADVRSLIAALRERLPEGAPLPAIVLKIETPLGLRNLPELIVEAGGATPVGVMIARGDLAVEIGFERLSEIQEEILWLCEAAQVPVIWATQVLEGMVKDGQASRAEVTDAAMGQRAECVMLNKGPHVVEAVGFLRGILARMDRHQTKKAPRLGPLHVWAPQV